jgi:DHA1 family bicyclomycin/chloramphenicol resistance-like MFS transporter
MSDKYIPGGKALIFLTIMLGCLNMFGPIGIDMFLAGVPNIAEALNTTNNRVIASISTLMLGNAFGQLVLGPLSDRLGRKPAILITLFIFTGSAFASGLSPTIEHLIFWRFIQGIAISSGRILAASVARDLFERERLGKMMADILFVTAISTVIFPVLGGQLAEHFPWQWLFWTMVIFGSIVFVLFAVFCKETIRELNPRALRPSYLLITWLETLRHPVFLKYVMCSSCVMAGFAAFLATSTTVLRGAFGVSAESYGVLFSVVAFFFLIATFVSGRIILKIGQHRLIAIGVLFALLGGVVMALLAVMEIREPLAVILPMAVYVMGLGMVFPQTNALALQPFPTTAGTAASLMGFITNLVAAGVVVLLSAMTHTDALNLGLATLTSAVLGSLTYFLIIRP